MKPHREVFSVLIGTVVLLACAACPRVQAAQYTFGTRIEVTLVSASKDSEARTDREAVPKLLREALEAKYRSRYTAYRITSHQSVEAETGEDYEFTVHDGGTLKIRVISYQPRGRVITLRLNSGYKNAIQDVRHQTPWIKVVKVGEGKEDHQLLVITATLLQVER